VSGTTIDPGQDLPVLHSTVYGDRRDPVLIILHGLFGSGDNWHAIARGLETGFRVLCADLRNHGRSFHHPVFSLAAMAEDVLRLLDSQGVGEASLVGHSLGGKVAMQTAITAPERITRLVVADIAPRRYSDGLSHVLDALFALDIDACGSRGEASDRLAETVAPRALRDFLLKNLVRNPDGDGWSWRLGLQEIRDSFENVFAAVDDGIYHRPTLFIRGDESDYIRDHDIPLISDRFPLARIVTVPGAGHWVHGDAPDEVLGHLRAFLEP
jgi:pimeloyl-ACP methyl ester carboxylesterase